MSWLKLKTFLGNIYIWVWSRNGFTVAQQCPVTNVWAHLPLKLWNITWMTNRIKLIVCPQIKPFLSFHFNTLAWLTFAIDSKNTFLFVWVSGCYSNASFHLTILPKCPSPNENLLKRQEGFHPYSITQPTWKTLASGLHLGVLFNATMWWLTKLLEACNISSFFDKALCETNFNFAKIFFQTKKESLISWVIVIN